jgi:hypothetical protein
VTAPRVPSNLEIVFADWVDAIRCGDIDRLAARLTPDVVHQGITHDLVCRGRDEVVDNARSASELLPPISALELVSVGSRVVLCVECEPLDLGPEVVTRFAVVFELEGGSITAIHDYRTRDEAMAAAGAV